MLACVSNVLLACFSACGAVDNYLGSAFATEITLSLGFAIAFSVVEVFGSYIFSGFVVQVCL